MDNRIVFEENYECLGLWTKIMKKRIFGTHRPDPYITTPEMKTLRSGAELYKFIVKNQKYWSVFDATLINFETRAKKKYSKWTAELKVIFSEIKRFEHFIFHQILTKLQHSLPSLSRQILFASTVEEKCLISENNTFIVIFG